ncbi:MAG: hypothetical protein ACOVOI_22085, partial [Hyphomicrobiales bacterium]
MTVILKAPAGEERDARRGVVMMLVGLALFSILNGVVKALAETFAVNQIVFFRNGFALVTLLLMARRLGGFAALKVHNRPGMALQAVQFTAVLLFIFVAYRHMPLADATAISFLQKNEPEKAHALIEEAVELDGGATLEILLHRCFCLIALQR